MCEYKKLYEYLDRLCENEKIKPFADRFRKCWLNTLETTVKFDENGEVFIITGDIEAMWLRDSSVQVSQYVRLAGIDEDVKKLIKSLLKRQFGYILVDPYANAFNEKPDGRGYKDDTELNDLVWERKYEIDSLIYPLWLLNLYYKYTSDSSVFDGLFEETYKKILDTLVTEQNPKDSTYYFRRDWDDEADDTLDNDGRGADYGYTGMVRSAFRPSDDKCRYPFLVPSNMFIVAVLKELKNILKDAGREDIFGDISDKLINDIENGIEKFALIETEKHGRIYAYEVDGLGNYLLMDDANVPSLLSMPYMNYCGKDDSAYLRTREFILSEDNPFYYEGTAAKGVGSPHTPKDYIWHIALIMEALTSDDEATTERILEYLLTTDADTGFMHESFHKDAPEKFTRSWFAWANTLFSIFVIDKILKV